jgi:hypothetical protein
MDLDGAPADLSAVVARCRASGRADVQATGGASIQAVEDVLRALHAAGVKVFVAETIGRTHARAVARKP